MNSLQKHTLSLQFNPYKDQNEENQLRQQYQQEKKSQNISLLQQQQQQQLQNSQNNSKLVTQNPKQQQQQQQNNNNKKKYNIQEPSKIPKFNLNFNKLPHYQQQLKQKNIKNQHNNNNSQQQEEKDGVNYDDGENLEEEKEKLPPFFNKNLLVQNHLFFNEKKFKQETKIPEKSERKRTQQNLKPLDYLMPTRQSFENSHLVYQNKNDVTTSYPHQINELDSVDQGDNGEDSLQYFMDTYKVKSPYNNANEYIDEFTNSQQNFKKFSTSQSQTFNQGATAKSLTNPLFTPNNMSKQQSNTCNPDEQYNTNQSFSKSVFQQRQQQLNKSINNTNNLVQSVQNSPMHMHRKINSSSSQQQLIQSQNQSQRRSQFSNNYKVGGLYRQTNPTGIQQGEKSFSDLPNLSEQFDIAKLLTSPNQQQPQSNQSQLISNRYKLQDQINMNTTDQFNVTNNSNSIFQQTFKSGSTLNMNENCNSKMENSKMSQIVKRQNNIQQTLQSAKQKKIEIEREHESQKNKNLVNYLKFMDKGRQSGVQKSNKLLQKPNKEEKTKFIDDFMSTIKNNSVIENVASKPNQPVKRGSELMVRKEEEQNGGKRLGSLIQQQRKQKAGGSIIKAPIIDKNKLGKKQEEDQMLDLQDQQISFEEFVKSFAANIDYIIKQKTDKIMFYQFKIVNGFNEKIKSVLYQNNKQLRPDLGNPNLLRQYIIDVMKSKQKENTPINTTVDKQGKLKEIKRRRGVTMNVDKEFFKKLVYYNQSLEEYMDNILIENVNFQQKQLQSDSLVLQEDLQKFILQKITNFNATPQEVGEFLNDQQQKLCNVNNNHLILKYLQSLESKTGKFHKISQITRNESNYINTLADIKQSKQVLIL